MKSVRAEDGLLFWIILSFSVIAAQPPTDTVIAEWVNGALSQDSRTASADIMVTVTGGIVTLTGNAENLVQKNFAELEAKKIKGVIGVVNRIIVKETDWSDIDIRQTILRRFIDSPVVPSELLNVKVENGTVILNGTVSHGRRPAGR